MTRTVYPAAQEQLIVSLTTWKARIQNIPAVLDSIFAQTLPPDLVVLNLAFDETVPDNVQTYLETHPVEVNRVPDTKVYKKLIPTLKKYPYACVVSIDDDWLYPPQMLEEFMRIHRQYPDHPISGNQVTSFRIPCHCGCASLTQSRFFGKYLDWIDDAVIRNCPSDDIVYTYFTKKNGYEYIRTEHLYFENMTPYNADAPYSAADSDTNPVQISWMYLVDRFGPAYGKSLRTFLHLFPSWLFELRRDASGRKFLRLFGKKFYLPFFSTNL